MKNGSFATHFPSLVKEWNYKKNTLAPEDVLPKSNSKVWWICLEKKHEWFATIASRSGGAGCPYCDGKKVTKDQSLKKLRPDIFSEWSPNNIDLDPCTIGIGSEKKAWWMCSKCNHEWQARVANRTSTNGTGCPNCAEKSRSQKKILKGIAISGTLAKRFPLIAKEWHKTKNKTSPNKLSPNSGMRVWWICKRNHEWQARVIDRAKNGTGCPFCSGQTSRLELRFLCEFKKIFQKVEWRAKCERHEIDILIHDICVGIEIDGYPWHIDKEKRDANKTNILKRMNYICIHIRDKRLTPIFSNDIIFEEKDPHIKIIHKFVNRLLRLGIDKDLKLKLSEYLILNKFISDEEYSDSLILLSGPLKEKSLGHLFPNLSEEWDSEKNKELTPFDVHPQSSLKVWWICSQGHNWQSTHHILTALTRFFLKNRVKAV